MKTAEFSEFSFGYALTESLVGALKPLLGHAPVFPSLIAEGSSGGGYDLKLPLLPFPLFLQFKIPQVLTRKSALRPPSYALPYYRMPLRTQAPNQHQLLLDLEKSRSDSIVLYATPLFHRLPQLDHGFMSKTVHLRTAFIRPSMIGPLDEKQHQVSYRPGATTYWLRSDLKSVGLPLDFEAFVQETLAARKQIRSRYEVKSGQPMDRSTSQVQLSEVERVAAWLRAKTGLDGEEDEASLLYSPAPADVRVFAAQLAFYAHVHLGVTLAWLEAASDHSESVSNSK